jgi:sirohydrochlorin ferrochelatase
VILLPYFLAAGTHVRRDLTAARDRLAARFPDVEFRLAEPLGQHPLLLEVIAERAREADLVDPARSAVH